MKVYILIPWFQPAYKAGGPIQSVANMVKQLAVGEGQRAVGSGQEAVGSEQLPVGGGQFAVGNGAFEFKIFCSNKDLDGSIVQGVAFDEWVPLKPVLAMTGSFATLRTKVWYSSANNILPVLKQEIKKEKPDYLFITGIYDWQYNLKPLLFCKGVKKIISVRGMLHPGALSQKGFKKKVYLWVWKMLGLHKGKAVGSEQLALGNGGNVFHATDVEEKKYIQQVFGNLVNIKVAANFPNVLAVQPVVQKEPGQLKLVSIALISPMKNILLVLEALGGLSLESGVGSRGEEGLSSESLGLSLESSVVSSESLRSNEILPFAESDIDRFAQQKAVSSDQDDSLRREVSIEYNIYGTIKDKQYWEACEAQIKKLPPNITVNYHGDIPPAEIIHALAANHVFILPSKSENYGHAIYEAFTAGRPVITSDKTPWNNLQIAKAGINVSLADTTELVQAIGLFAAMKQGELEAWSKGARVYAEKAVDVEEIRRQYEGMFG